MVFFVVVVVFVFCVLCGGGVFFFFYIGNCMPDTYCIQEARNKFL